MKQTTARPPNTIDVRPDLSVPAVRRDAAPLASFAPLALWQLNLLRAGYLVMGGGLALVKWPLLVRHAPWSLAAGTVECLLVALSVLALLGLRYPERLLPVLLFEVAWKLLWLGVVALPLWRDGRLEGAALEQAVTVAWVVVIVAVVPWRQVLARYLRAPAEPWRRARQAPPAS